MDTEIASYMFLGVGAAVSLIGFFVKRLKEDIDVVKQKQIRQEINMARNFERINNLEKLSEDRRHDIKKIYEQLNKTEK